jgi:hypothetical protein
VLRKSATTRSPKKNRAPGPKQQGMGHCGRVTLAWRQKNPSEESDFFFVSALGPATWGGGAPEGRRRGQKIGDDEVRKKHGGNTVRGPRRVLGVPWRGRGPRGSGGAPRGRLEKCFANDIVVFRKPKFVRARRFLDFPIQKVRPQKSVGGANICALPSRHTMVGGYMRGRKKKRV